MTVWFKDALQREEVELVRARTTGRAEEAENV
jgi:hypothetical protein